MVKRLIPTAAALLAPVVMSSFALNAGAFSVEQIQAEMPDITVYISSDHGTDGVELLLDRSPLEIESAEKFSEADIPACYYFLIDDSGSVTYDQMNAVKSALKENSNFIRSSDTVKLISVGTLDTLFSGSVSDEGFADAVDSFTNDKQETFLYQALQNVSEEILCKSDDTGVRNVIIAFSDGLNEAVGKTTYSEIASLLHDNGVPLYAMGMEGTYSSDLESFGELARATGGSMYAFLPSECSDTYSDAGRAITECYALKAKADSNLTGISRTVTVRSEADSFSCDYTITPVKWIPDTVPPEILSAEIISANQMKITFSEDVLGADIAGNFIINRPRTAVEVTSASYSSANGVYSAVITASEHLSTSDYTISAVNITDNSNEKNPVSADYTARLKGTVPADIPEEGKDKSSLVNIALIAAGALLFVISCITAILIMRKRPPEPAPAPETPEQQPVRISQRGSPKRHVLSGSPDSHCITLVLTDGRELRAAVDPELTVGRSEKNDIFFDDMNMSRSHFIIRCEDGKFFIFDNNSTSGTFLNGTPVTAAGSEIPQNSLISAGSTKISVRW